MTIYLVFGCNDSDNVDTLLEAYGSKKLASTYIENQLEVGLFDYYFIQEVYVKGVQYD